MASPKQPAAGRDKSRRLPAALFRYAAADAALRACAGNAVSTILDTWHILRDDGIFMLIVAHEKRKAERSVGAARARLRRPSPSCRATRLRPNCSLAGSIIRAFSFTVALYCRVSTLIGTLEAAGRTFASGSVISTHLISKI